MPPRDEVLGPGAPTAAAAAGLAVGTSREVAPNKPLSATEAKAILRDLFERCLAGEGLLQGHTGFGRFTAHVRITIQADSILQGKPSVTQIGQPFPGHNVIAAHPELAPVEKFPLADPPPSPDAVVSSHEATRRVTSPNQERLRHGLPIDVVTRQQDNTLRTDKVQYAVPEDLGDGDVTVRDSTADAVKDLGLPSNLPTPQPPTLEEAAALEATPSEKRDFFDDAPPRDGKASWPTTEPS